MVALREISVDDAAQISSLSFQLGYKINIADTVSQIQNVMSHPDHCAFVIADNERILGWIHAFKTLKIESKSSIEIGGLVVDENHRGRGIGRRLVERVKEWSKESDIPVLRVRTSIKRNDAHTFYNSLGFSESKEQKVFEITV